MYDLLYWISNWEVGAGVQKQPMNWHCRVYKSRDLQGHEVKVMDKVVRMKVIMARQVNWVITGYMKAERDSWGHEVEAMDKVARINVIMVRQVNQVITGYMKAEICGVKAEWTCLERMDQQISWGLQHQCLDNRLPHVKCEGRWGKVTTVKWLWLGRGRGMFSSEDWVAQGSCQKRKYSHAFANSACSIMVVPRPSLWHLLCHWPLQFPTPSHQGSVLNSGQSPLPSRLMWGSSNSSRLSTWQVNLLSLCV